jgi:hypothetical protein
MSSRLDNKIRTMMQQVVDESPAPPDLPSGPPPEPVTSRRVRRRWHPAVVFVVAAVAVLLIGVPLLLFGVSSSAPVTEEPTVTTTVPPATTTALTTTTPLVTSGGWENVATTDVFGSPTLVDGVVAAGSGFVAVGELMDREGTVTAVVAWISVDGVDWEPVDVPIIEAPPPTMSRWQLDAGPPGIVLWSYSMSDDEADSRLFFSTDGLAWREVTAGPDRVHAAAASEQGFITVGDTFGGMEIYASNDGLVWNRVDAEIPTAVRGFHGVTGWNDGWVAWGWGCTPTGGCDASSTTEDGIWISADGTTWTKLDANRSVFQDASIWAVEEYRGELYAVGDVVVDDESTPAAWVSANGRDWEKVLSDPDSLGVLWGVATSADMIVARGSHAEEALDRPDEVWMSRNGREWNVIGSNETFGTPGLKQLAVSDNRIVAGGSPNWDVWPPTPAILSWAGEE